MPLSAPSTLRRRAECPTIAPKLRAGLAAATGAQIFAKSAPVPRHPFLECSEGNALDTGQQTHHVVGVDLVQRGYGESAVTGDHRRDAMERRRREEGVPEDLGVKVCVHIDESRAQHQSGSIDVPTSRRADERIAQPQSPGFDADGCDYGVLTRPVNNGSRPRSAHQASPTSEPAAPMNPAPGSGKKSSMSMGLKRDNPPSAATTCPVTHSRSERVTAASAT